MVADLTFRGWYRTDMTMNNDGRTDYQNVSYQYQYEFHP